MSISVLKTSKSNKGDQPEQDRLLRAIAYADFAVLTLALPLFVIGHLPLLGFLIAGLAWTLQRVIATSLERRIQASSNPRTIVGLTAGGAIGRGWLVALAILGVGLLDQKAGLSAALLIIGLYTTYFVGKLLLRSLSKYGQVLNES